MNLKTLYASAGILAVIAGIIYFARTHDSAPLDDPRIGGPLVHPPSLRAAMKIELDGGDSKLTFTRDSENSRWLLAERANMPADMNKLTQALSPVTDAKLERLVTSKPDRIAELGFGGEGIVFYDGSGSQIVKIEVGRPTESSKQLIRLNNEDKAFLSSAEISLDGDPDAWLAKDLLTFDRDSVRSAEIVFANGDTLSVSRDSKEAEWTSATPLPEGKILDQSGVSRAVNRFATLKFTKTAALDAKDVTDAQANQHRYTIGLENGQSYAVEIGRRPEVKEAAPSAEEGKETPKPKTTPAGPVFVKIEASDATDPVNQYMASYAFEVAASSFTSLPANLNVLLTDAPTPEPEPEVEATPAEPEPATSE